MYLSRFGVKNYKCLGDIDIPLTPIHVLIGQNDCGKTSLLEAMAAFFATSEKPLGNVFPEPWSGRELVRHGSTEPRVELSGNWERFAAESGPPPFGYGLVLDFGLNGQGCTVSKEWITAGGSRRPLWNESTIPENERQALVRWWAEIGPAC